MTQRTENIMTAIFEKPKAELAAYRCLCPLTAFFDDLELSGNDKKYIMVIPLTHLKKTAINYPFVYRIFSRCAKGIVINYIDKISRYDRHLL